MRLTSRGTKSKNYGLPSCPSPFLAIGTCDVSQLPPQQIHLLALLNHASPLRVIKNYLVCYFSFSLLFCTWLMLKSGLGEWMAKRKHNICVRVCDLLVRVAVPPGFVWPWNHFLRAVDRVGVCSSPTGGEAKQEQGLSRVKD